MNFIGEDLFPLARFIVTNQTRKFGTSLKNVIIADVAETAAAGYYDDREKGICLNIGMLNDPEIKLRFNIPKVTGETEEEERIRCGAAILFEECYHAAHHGTELNTEELATAYGRQQASRLPTAILTKNTIKEKKEKPVKSIPTNELQERIILPIVSGGMYNYINVISKKGKINGTIDTQYGSMEVINDEHITTIKHTTDIEKLNEAKNHLGNVTTVGIEYAGMIYTYENAIWKTFVDVDTERMAEVEMTRPVEVYLTKIEGQDSTVELKR